MRNIPLNHQENRFLGRLMAIILFANIFYRYIMVNMHYFPRNFPDIGGMSFKVVSSSEEYKQFCDFIDTLIQPLQWVDIPKLQGS